MKKYLRRFSAVLCALALCLTNAFALSVEDALMLLEANYVDDLPAAAYEATTLDELLRAIGDPYTSYMDAETYERFNASIEGDTSLTGIGVSIHYVDDGILILKVLEGGGAKDAGLRGGDIIIAIDGESCVPGGEQYISRISGEAGTFVDITVRHEDGSVETFSVERRLIELRNTTVTFEDGVGHIECDSFGSRTSEYFSDAMERYGDEARAWIVDLRDNGGGYAIAAVNTAGMFSGHGAKLYLIDHARASTPYSYYGADLTDSPAIVLVNGNTASASEIFSGDIRAEHTGIVVGSRTYGKGLAQMVFYEATNPDLFDGDALKISTDRFYCVDGDTTDKIGVVPTLLVRNEYTEAIAALLETERPESGEYLCFMLNDCLFYVDLAASRGSNALAELFAALPPDVMIHCESGGTVSELDPAGTAARCGVTYTDRRFTDLSESAYPTQIDTLAVYGMLRGSGDGQFHPDQLLTRAELCAMLAQALNFTSNGNQALFSDVTSNRWFAGDVNAIASIGLVNGVGDGRFDPSGTLTQEQFITIMGRLTRFLNFYANAYADDLSEEEMLSNRSLTAFAPWSHESASVLTGYSGNMLYTELGEIAPKTAVTREQAAATLCNILKALDIISY